MVVLTACDDFVEVDQPNSQLTNTAVFENTTTANAAVADVYAQIRENGAASGRLFGLSCLLGTYTDELVSYESGSYSTADFYNNTLLASNSFISQEWNGTYNQIYAANAIIEGVEKSAYLPQQDKDQLTGEALFLRAFLHFGLVNTFGDIPYVTSTDYITNSTVTRLPKAAVYQNIISDLENAITLLPEQYLQPTRTRACKKVAQALLSRVYLYNGDNAEAADMASAVINDDADFIWEADLDKVFLKESTATIWQLESGTSGGNTYEGSTFIFLAGPPNTIALSDNFISQFEAGDLRRTHWVKEVTDGVSTWYHPYKYKQDVASGSSMEYSVILRLAEQYLIRAEARARQGELVSSKDDIDKIRINAGLPQTTATTQGELLDAILQERRSELFTEHGHRFFDLKRFGKLDEVLSSKIGWNQTDQLWPLPQSELRANPFLSPQNPGY